MKTTSFTERILITGAVLASLIILSQAALVLWKAAGALGNWRNWLRWETLSPLAVGLLMLLLAAALDAAVWRRIVSRHRSFQDASVPGFRSLTPRGKYAFWKPARPANGRNATFGTVKPRKKAGR